MMKIFNWSQLSPQEKIQILSRPLDLGAPADQVREIILQVKEKGYEAILHYTEKFDRVRMGSAQLKVSPQEVVDSLGLISDELRQALIQAARNIEKFHRAQKASALKISVQSGVVCEQVERPIQRVGIYVPGGSAPLFSTVLMLAIPAKIAGCGEIVVATPPQSDGSIHPAILAACQLAGVDEIIKVGGAQAIATLAFGCEELSPVMKIFGPGNSWVTEAKRQVTQLCPSLGCDLPAGPSEVLVIVDESAHAEFVAWDLLSQAEHGPDSQVILVSPNKNKIMEVLTLIEKIVPELDRQKIVQKSLSSSRAIICSDLGEAVEISNLYAPEHLIIDTQNARELLPRVESAGSVFLGPWSPESVGDYASGTNHVLPTSGAANYTGGVSLQSFVKKMSVQELSSEGLFQLAPTVEVMAQEEGLFCHSQAVAVRRKRAAVLRAPSVATEEKIDPEALVKKLVRPTIGAMRPYSSARSHGQAQVLLDANEWPWSSQSRYPEPQPEVLIHRLANLYGVSGDNVLVTRGSDEAVDLLLRTFCEPSQSSIMVHPPTFEIYAHAARIQGARVIEVPLDEEFDLDKEQIVRMIASESDLRLIFLCSPNNPTGNCLTSSRIETVLQQAGDSALVVIDEAYIELAEQASWVSRLQDFPQLVILRTLSKYWAAAGLRCGVALAHPAIITQLRKVLAPYPIAEPVVTMVLEHLKQQPPSLAKLFEVKAQVQEILEKMPYVAKVWPSDANFMLVTFHDSNWVFENLLKVGIRVRDRSHLWPNSLRISLGYGTESEKLLQALIDLGEQWSQPK